MSLQCHTVVADQLEEIVSAAAPPSVATKFLKFIRQHSSKAKSHIFPGNFLYSFEDGHFWISLSFIPASESLTQVRYDMFGLSSTTGNNEGALTNSIAEAIKNILQKIETEFSSVTPGSLDISSNTSQILDQLQGHLRLEKKNGSQILPAMRQPKGSSLFQQAEQRTFCFKFWIVTILTYRIVCKDIDCAGSGSRSGSGSNGLDW